MTLAAMNAHKVQVNAVKCSFYVCISKCQAFYITVISKFSSVWHQTHRYCNLLIVTLACPIFSIVTCPPVLSPALATVTLLGMRGSCTCNWSSAGLSTSPQRLLLLRSFSAVRLNWGVIWNFMHNITFYSMNSRIHRLRGRIAPLLNGTGAVSISSA
jgi:hypothetical protein